MTTTAGATPRAFRLPGYPVAVGPFTHVAAERDRLTALRWRSFDARQLGSTVGAEITGVDLGAELPDEVVAELRRALHDYKVIFFRDQPLTPHQHVAFARRFGDLEVHPFLASNTGEPELVRFEKTAEVSGYENSWHHDVTWRECPSMGAILHAVDGPGPRRRHAVRRHVRRLRGAGRGDQGGDRRPRRRARLHPDLRPHHGREERRRAQEQYPPVLHPVVCTHAVTGRRHLYVNRPFVSHIQGLDRDASVELLDRLCRQADAPEHQCRFTWSPDAVAFWDNRAVQHYASSDYWPQRRTMERASVTGTTPVAESGLRRRPGRRSWACQRGRTPCWEAC